MVSDMFMGSFWRGQSTVSAMRTQIGNISLLPTFTAKWSTVISNERYSPGYERIPEIVFSANGEPQPSCHRGSGLNCSKNWKAD